MKEKRLEAVLNLFSTNFIKYNLESGRIVTIQLKLFLIYHLPNPFGVVRLPCVMASSNRDVIARNEVTKQSRGA